ncbi:uncharacterized protein LOC116574587 isoform X1 [Mustela erminea]|uniref:uncharacterized protein LOC116574587 isoform X1 n=1 Tax=Mustela erminea TaxID=36723 RepID=UPI001387584C|nr:uncharacterized protein LOC116574587 isoform X1 [Mustela erminea]
MTSSKILNHQCRLKGSYLPATHFMSLVSNIPGVTLSKSKTSRRGEADLGSGGFLTGAERKGKKTFSSSSLPGKQPFLDDGLGPAFPPGTSTCRHYKGEKETEGERKEEQTAQNGVPADKKGERCLFRASPALQVMDDSIQTFKSMAPSAFRKQRVSGLECRMVPSRIISSQLLPHISEGHPVYPIVGIFDSSPTFTSPSPPVTMFCQLLNLRKTLFRCYSQN